MKIVDSLVPLVPKLWIIVVALWVPLFPVNHMRMGILTLIIYYADRRSGLPVFSFYIYTEILRIILLYLLVLLTAEWFKARNIKKQGLGVRG